MAHYTDFANFITIILIPFNAVVLTILSFNVLDVPSRLDFKPFNCFTCSTFWFGVVLTLLFYTKITNFDFLIIQTTIEAGFLIGYEIDKRQYK